MPWESGKSPPAEKPCSTRKAIRAAALRDDAQATDASVNAATWPTKYPRTPIRAATPAERGIAIRLAVDHPDRVDRLVLMGSVGISFPITEGLDSVWGYQPSIENMRRIVDYFAYSRELVNDELAEVRYRAALAPGVQEAFSSMFPAPRQRWVEAMATPGEQIRAIPHETLIIHGREDKVIPLDNAYRLLGLIERSELHVFGRCGHWSQIEWADDVNALLGRFLGRDAR